MPSMSRGKQDFDGDVVATRDLIARQVEGWDSLGNVRFFVEIERAFAIASAPPRSHPRRTSASWPSSKEGPPNHRS